jgi:hypothetical protein
MSTEEQQLSTRLDEAGRYRMPDISRGTRYENPFV